MNLPRMVVALLPAVVLVFAVSSASGDEWEPVPGRLLSRFAKDVDPGAVHPEYPRPHLRRERWRNLNGLWQFSVAAPDGAPPVGKELAGKILVPFPVESSLSGQGKMAHRVWYRRYFEVPDAWRGDRILLHFGAVDWEARVWVNGEKLGIHRGGYDAFSFDVTGALRQSGPQELVVGVCDPTDMGFQPRGKQVLKPRGIWYTPTTGIWQTVWLEPVPHTGIRGLKVVPDVDRSLVRVTVAGCGTGADHSVRIIVREKGEHGVRQVTGSGPPGKAIEVPLSSPRLWSPATPFLYDLEVHLLEGERVLDRVQSYFGMRKISVGKGAGNIARILLNDEFLFQLGPLDQGFWPDGLYTAPTDEALRYDIEVMKRLGFNMVRKHVKIEPHRWYYWCDRLGLLVWQDMPSGDRYARKGRGAIDRSEESAGQFETELRRLVEGFGNHPSIVMWVVFNEGWGQYDTKRLTNRVRKLDPGRLVCSASGWNDVAGVGDVHDIHAYPGPASPQPEDSRAAVLGEFGGLGLPIREHVWQEKKNWGYRNMKTRAELNRNYLALLSSLRFLISHPGLSAAVYTQITDVEIEVNGLMTYDRAVIKVDSAQLRDAHRILYQPPPRLEVAVATSEKQPAHWRYSFEKPPSGWFRSGFDDRGWKRGPGGFGTKGTPGAVVRSEWKSGEIWLRRSFELDDLKGGTLVLRIHHDEDVEVYLNGIPAAKRGGYTVEYIHVEISPEACSSLECGSNVMAVHCRQTRGGQYIDAGLVRLMDEKRE